ncbi:MAG: hypothetical protein ACREXX_10775 [Gammaproteobacteria bacterium]
MLSTLFRSNPILNLDGTGSGTTRFEVNLMFHRPNGVATEENLFTQALEFGTDITFRLKMVTKDFANPGSSRADCDTVDECRIRVIATEVDLGGREVLGCFQVDGTNNGSISSVLDSVVGTSVTGGTAATLLAPSAVGNYRLLLDATDDAVNTCSSVDDWHDLNPADAVGLLSVQ